MSSATALEVLGMKMPLWKDYAIHEGDTSYIIEALPHVRGFSLYAWECSPIDLYIIVC